MRQALGLLAALQAQIPEAKHFRLVRGPKVTGQKLDPPHVAVENEAGCLAVEFVVDGRVPRYFLEDSDLDRPVGEIANEIVMHHRAQPPAPLPTEG